MDVVFAVLPFADVSRPSIGVSTLLAGARKAGFSARIEYFNLPFAQWMGLDLYKWIAELGDQLLLDTTTPSVSLIGEWFFAGLLFPGQLPPDDEYLDRFVAPDRVPALLEARQKYALRIVQYAAREILKHGPKVVGFTSTFHQTCCCLAVAKLLKESAHPPAIIFGGANCEGEMGRQLIRSFPWIDYICTGEGDEVMPAFLDRYIRADNPEPPHGILRQGFADALQVPPPVARMDELPVPDYHDYFDALRRSGLTDVKPILTVQTARGCWWGEKHHCTFCGLNGDSMGYRSKSPQRVISELVELSESYRVQRMDSVDNILDTRYIQTLFPELIRRNADLDLFYEIKANLRYDQLKTLRRGGVRSVQPGIESFSNSVLQLMRKGCTGLQNIQLLRWCEELDVFPIWNMLYGFPHESPAEYERMAALIPLLVHLPPPVFCIRVRMDRFSPLYHQAAEFGLENVRSMEAYSYVYPFPERVLRNLAYFFEFEYGDGRQPVDYARPLVERIEEWVANRARLDAYSAGEMLVIVDTRPCAPRRQHLFTGLAARVYRECDTAVKVPSLARRMDADVCEVENTVSRFVDEGLMVEMDGQVLSLAVFRNRAEVPETVLNSALVNLA